MARLCVAGPDGHRGDQAWAQKEDRFRDRPAQHRRVAAQLHPGEWAAGAGCHPQLWHWGVFLAWGPRPARKPAPMVALLQADLLEWLCVLGLPQYHKQLVSSGYDSMGLVADLTWEELQEIGVNKLGEHRLCWGPPARTPYASEGLQHIFRAWEGPGRPSLAPANPPTHTHLSQAIRRS